MKTRVMAGVFLIKDGKTLLIHRNKDKKLAPNVWSCIGGHMKPQELNDPEATCYRELFEETGITNHMIKNLRLKYITYQIINNEIQIGYCYFGDMINEYVLPSCNEGTLHWVDIADITKKAMSLVVTQIVLHWLSNPEDNEVYVGTVNKESNIVTWAAL
ncbi:hypothetical protein SDC9_110166 [bioreactor metagenome]|uniref:Nudix hydrolase domain-containing protein n=1 Tax=bioreactor metagenome TaxID=1076179 RepID=A0A645BDV3_9ZZZZ|nr:NUDIX domain-containing protein [Oscillospiraceae bacterium]